MYAKLISPGREAILSGSSQNGWPPWEDCFAGSFPRGDCYGGHVPVGMCLEGNYVPGG